MESKFYKIFLKIFWIYTSILSVIFVSFYYYIKLSLLLGFLIGSQSSSILFEIRNFFTSKALQKTKHPARTLSFLGFIIGLALIAAVTIISIFINHNSNQIFLLNEKLNKVIYPINLFAFLFGILTTPISIVISVLILRKGVNNGKD
ncbi:hypothetical protein [Mycoplasma sp. Mirounga ES2805-ORL]|uniref:hypothetical protein n=1 Tax=Mycoplasma sp. Mirounga ES2805-ORL TaxID=754514 RepID=UPI00197BDD5D|nr:hypothetical protein [Mycoplasma sp. Mirounga ES2805-ORL]QSF13829.1 hypothetical protein JXZ90_00815 [Mycoplasma sp. Mirounga ES2805-ORL]